MATQANFRSLVLDPLAVLGEGFKRLIKFPETWSSWFNQVTDEDGYILGTLYVGDYLFSSAPIQESDTYRLAIGQELQIEYYPQLWNAFGRTHLYGEASSANNFKLPDFRFRMPLQSGQTPAGKKVVVGTYDGEEAHSLIETELATTKFNPKIRKDQQRAYKADGGGVLKSSSDRNGVDPRVVDLKLKDITFGGGKSHNNMPPYIGFFVYIRVK
jgi:microcystin-dependent protein